MEYKEFLEETIKKCKTKADFCRALDKKPTGGNYKTIDNIIKQYNLDCSHFSKDPWNKGISYNFSQYPIEEILVKNSPILNTFSLKKRLIKLGIKEYKCEVCGYTDNVELHHINGDPTDNRLENLQMLCPNCHSKTENYRSKNIKSKTRQHKSPEELILSKEEVVFRDQARILAHKKGILINEAKKLLESNPNIINETFKKNNYPNKKCPICGKEFHSRHLEQIYCSVECANKNKAKNIPSKEELIQVMINLKGNFTQIGKHFGVTDNAVRKWCVKYDIPKTKKNLIDYLNNLNNPNYKKSEEIKIKREYNSELICKIYKEGYNQKDIAAYIGCCQDTVKKVLLQNNIPLRSKTFQKIGQYSLDGKLLQIYYSAEEAMRWLVDQNIAKTSGGSHHILKCCRKESISAYGYKWGYIPRKPITEFNKE